MLLAHRLSSCMHGADQNNCPKNACVQFVRLHLRVHASLTCLISMYGPAKLFHNGVLLMFFFICMINSACLT